MTNGMKWFVVGFIAFFFPDDGYLCDGFEPVFWDTRSDSAES